MIRWILLMLSLCATIDFASTTKPAIASEKKIIKEQTNTQSSLEKTLANTEIKIGQLSKQIKSTAQKIAQNKKQLAQLNQKLQASQQSLHQQSDFAMQSLQSYYVLSRQSKWSAYFSSDSTDNVDRYLTYSQAINTTQLHVIKNLQHTIQQLQSTSKAIDKKATQLQNLYNQLTKEQNTAKTEQKKRSVVLKQLHTSIQSHQQQLNSLQSNQNQLTQIVTKLDTHSPQKTFAQMKTHLPWPIEGKITNVFGSPMLGRMIKWKGDLISAPLNTPVKAIFTGKVIYADWLRGYGLLIIIDHGNGFVSLYGRNHSLYKQTGDTVAIGETIATVGRSGGFATPALYFELRHKGAPLNPRYWMQRM